MCAQGHVDAQLNGVQVVCMGFRLVSYTSMWTHMRQALNAVAIDLRNRRVPTSLDGSWKPSYAPVPLGMHAR
jgi:hypothetical protein